MKADGIKDEGDPVERLEAPRSPQSPPSTMGSSPGIQPDVYLQERAVGYRNWYHVEARRMKGRFLGMRSMTVVGGALVPVLVNLHFRYVTPTTTVVSLIVVALVALESVFHYRERWINYRTTAEFLWHEEYHYKAGTGPYRDLPESEAFSLLVERVEGAIAAENASTLSTMTLVGHAMPDEGNPAAKRTHS